MNQQTHTPLTNLEIHQRPGFTAITCTPTSKILAEYAGRRVSLMTLPDMRQLKIHESEIGWDIIAIDGVHKLPESVERRYSAYGKIYFYRLDRDTEGNLIGKVSNTRGPVIYLAGDKYYGLSYHNGLYRAGCREFTYEQAIRHWSYRLSNYGEICNAVANKPKHAELLTTARTICARATKFLAAIEAHQGTLRSIEDACKYI